MSDLFLLSEPQTARIEDYFPLSHGVPRVDDRRVARGVVYVIPNGLQWKDAPRIMGGRRRSLTASSAGAGAHHDRCDACESPSHGGEPL